MITEWIAITEKMPMPHTETLAYDTHKFCTCIATWDGDKWTLDDAFYTEVHGVTHWMPLPNPPSILTHAKD